MRSVLHARRALGWSLLFALAASAFCTALIGASVADSKTSLNLLWSMPVPASQDGSSRGLLVLDLVKPQNDSTPILLAESHGRFALLKQASAAGPGPLLPIQIPSGTFRLATDGREGVWIGGTVNSRYSLTSGPLSDAYFAQIDEKGRIRWEKTIQGGERRIDGLEPLPGTSDFIAVGAHNDQTWLARLSRDGDVVWQNLFGVAKGVAVAATGDRIIVASFEAVGSRPNYREDFAVRVFSHAGELTGKRVLREAVSRSGIRGHLGVVSIVRDAEFLYVLDGWQEPGAVKPLQITKLDAEQNVRWQKEIQESVFRPRGRPRLCASGAVRLNNGDVLVACSFSESIELLRLEAQSGKKTVKSLPAPECLKGQTTSVFPILAEHAKLKIFGSSTITSYDGCTWLGAVPLASWPR